MKLFVTRSRFVCACPRRKIGVHFSAKRAKEKDQRRGWRSWRKRSVPTIPVSRTRSTTWSSCTPNKVNIGPDPAGNRLKLGQYRHRRIVGVDAFRAHDVDPDGLNSGIECYHECAPSEKVVAFRRGLDVEAPRQSAEGGKLLCSTWGWPAISMRR